MKRLKRVTTRLLAIMLTGAMMIGNPSLSVLAAEDDQGTAEVIVEESEEEAAGDPYNTGVTEDSVTEDSSEEMEKEAAAEGTSVERGSKPDHASEAAEGEADSSVGEAPDHAIEDGAASYVVTLDANGGHFENERDDILGEILETAEILTRIIPAGEAVRSIPVYGKTAEDGQKGTFLGWSLEKNSEAAVKEDYVPVRDCTLFAVWDVEEGLSEENSSEGNSSEENSSEGNSSEENSSAEVIPEEIDDAEESAGETAAVPEENIAAEDANDGVARAEESEISLPDGGKNGGLEEENVSSPPSYGKVTGISAKANAAATVKNYEVSKTVKATLKNGVLTVSGSGAIPNYDYSNSPKWLDEISEIKKVIIGTGITRIGDWAFMDTVNLESVSWGSVTSIGEAAFCRSGLKSVTIPDRVTTIGMFAFEECPNLTSVVIGNGVKEIPYDCFYSCEALTSVTFGSGVQKIDNLAFAYCGIETLTLPANIKELGVGTFGECRKLKKVTTKGLIHVAYQAFFNDTALTSVTLNEGIEYIYKLAFYGCSSLSSVTIPKSVREIVDEAFPANTVIINKNKNLERVGTNGYRVDECLYINGTEDYSKAYEVLNLVNKERKAAGLETLKMDGSLLKTAMLRAAEITLYFSHTRPDGTDCFTANSKMFGETLPRVLRQRKTSWKYGWIQNRIRRIFWAEISKP